VRNCTTTAFYLKQALQNCCQVAFQCGVSESSVHITKNYSGPVNLKLNRILCLEIMNQEGDTKGGFKNQYSMNFLIHNIHLCDTVSIKYLHKQLKDLYYYFML